MKFDNFLVASLALLLLSCSENPFGGGIMCTEEFVMVGVSIQDTSGKPFALDKSFSIRENSLDTFKRNEEGNAWDGFHRIADDGDLKKISKSGTPVVFHAYVKDSLVVSEKYVVGRDDCHIQLISGKTKIILK